MAFRLHPSFRLQPRSPTSVWALVVTCDTEFKADPSCSWATDPDIAWDSSLAWSKSLFWVVAPDSHSMLICMFSMATTPFALENQSLLLFWKFPWSFLCGKVLQASVADAIPRLFFKNLSSQSTDRQNSLWQAKTWLLTDEGELHFLSSVLFDALVNSDGVHKAAFRPSCLFQSQHRLYEQNLIVLDACLLLRNSLCLPK